MPLYSCSVKYRVANNIAEFSIDRTAYTSENFVIVVWLSGRGLLFNVNSVFVQINEFVSK